MTKGNLIALEKARKTPRAKRPSMRKAIDNMCKWCIYDPLAGLGAWREQTEGCTSTDCPLWELRPKSTAKRSLKASSDGKV